MSIRERPDPFEDLVAQVVAQAEDLGAGDDEPPDFDPSRIDVEGWAKLARLTHAGLAQYRPGVRRALLACWDAGDTTVTPVLLPNGRPALLSIVGGRPIVAVELSELVPLDDL